MRVSGRAKERQLEAEKRQARREGSSRVAGVVKDRANFHRIVGALLSLVSNSLVSRVGANQTLQSPQSLEESQRLKKPNMEASHHKIHRSRKDPQGGDCHNKQRLTIHLQNQLNRGVYESLRSHKTSTRLVLQSKCNPRHRPQKHHQHPMPGVLLSIVRLR